MLALGVERSFVKMAVLWKLSHTGVPFTTPEGLIEAAFNISDEQEQTHRSEMIAEK